MKLGWGGGGGGYGGLLVVGGFEVFATPSPV